MNSLPVTPTEKWAAIGALAAALAALAKKMFTRNRKPKPEYITRLEFHQGLDAVRDRINAGYLALGDKLDATQKALLTAIHSQGATFEQRLDTLETNLARLDERTTARRR